MSESNFHVFTNLAVSMDGKITTAAREHIDPSPYDRYMMDRIRMRADALLMGAGTLRAFKQAAKVDRKRFQFVRKARKLNPHPINVIVARKLDFNPSWPFFRDNQVERVLVVPEGTPETEIKPYQALAHIFKYDTRHSYPDQLLTYLRRLGCKSLLLEGGGGVMFPWVERDLIDEWNITLVPKVIGGADAPTMVEGNGFDAAHIKQYRLKRTFKRGDELFLQYTRRS